MRPMPMRAPGARRERGVVLWVAIIVLVAMTLAGLAMMRQMSAGASIAGNIAFKESATAVADRGAEKARAWLTANPGVLSNDNFAVGYHSSWAASVDPGTFNWAQAMDLSDPLLDPPNLDPGRTGNRALWIFLIFLIGSSLLATILYFVKLDDVKLAAMVDAEGGF